MDDRFIKIGKRLGWIAVGASVGTLVMYFFDPERGRRRRHFVRDKANHYSNEAIRTAARPFRRLFHRVRGLSAQLAHPLSIEVDDDILNSRVRSEFGRKVSHASAIESRVAGGVVTLVGHVSPGEALTVVDCVRRIPGVKGVVNRLDTRLVH